MNVRYILTTNTVYCKLSSDNYDTDRLYHILEKHIRQTAEIVKTGTDVHFSVTTSADAEHWFLKYNQLLTPRRTRLAAETLRMLEFLYWNLNT